MNSVGDGINVLMNGAQAICELRLQGVYPVVEDSVPPPWWWNHMTSLQHQLLPFVDLLIFLDQFHELVDVPVSNIGCAVQPVVPSFHIIDCSPAVVVEMIPDDPDVSTFLNINQFTSSITS